jgi:hypothetical protein
MLNGRIDVDRARAIWIDALDARCSTATDNSQPSSTSAHVGSVTRRDLAVAWTLLTDDGRQAFRDELAVDQATWRRGRGWALWKAVATCSSTHEDPDGSAQLAEAEQVLDAIFRDAAS